MRTFLYILAGMIIMLIILKFLQKKDSSNSETWQWSKKILSSGQFYNLTKTNEFRELLKMPETRKLIESLAQDQISELSKSLY